MLSFAFTAVIALAKVNGYELLPSPTHNLAGPLGWTPKPTTPALLPNNNHDLLRLNKRDYPAATCGYVDGSVISDNAITCPAPDACGFNLDRSMFGCCQSTITSDNSVYLADCAYFSACYDSTAICDESCQSDTEVAKCTSSGNPYCVKYTLFAGTNSFSNFGCNSNATDTVTVYSNSDVSTTSASYAITSSSVIITTTSTATPSSVPTITSVPTTSSMASVVPFTESQASASGGVPTVTVTTNAAVKLDQQSWRWIAGGVFVFMFL